MSGGRCPGGCLLLWTFPPIQHLLLDIHPIPKICFIWVAPRAPHKYLESAWTDTALSFFVCKHDINYSGSREIGHTEKSHRNPQRESHNKCCNSSVQESCSLHYFVPYFTVTTVMTLSHVWVFLWKWLTCKLFTARSCPVKVFLRRPDFVSNALTTPSPQPV